jgi:hypothetical protein
MACLIQDVVSPHCGDKRMVWEVLCGNTFSWGPSIGMGKNVISINKVTVQFMLPRRQSD